MKKKKIVCVEKIFMIKMMQWLAFFLFCRQSLKNLSPKQRVEVIEARTLSSVGEGNILEFTAKGTLRASSGIATQSVIADIWSGGNLIDHGVRLILPLRLSGGEIPFVKGSLLVFMGKAYPKSMGGKDKDWCWRTHMITPTSSAKASAIAKELSNMRLDELKAKFERGTLEKFKPGTIITLWELRSATSVGNGEKDSYGVVRYSTEQDLANGDVELDEGEITIPGRFLDRLQQPGALPCNALYEGKRKNVKGNREYHDLHFIDGNDPKIRNLLKGIIDESEGR